MSLLSSAAWGRGSTDWKAEELATHTQTLPVGLSLLSILFFCLSHVHQPVCMGTWMFSCTNELKEKQGSIKAEQAAGR